MEGMAGRPPLAQFAKLPTSFTFPQRRSRVKSAIFCALLHDAKVLVSALPKLIDQRLIAHDVTMELIGVCYEGPPITVHPCKHYWKILFTFDAPERSPRKDEGNKFAPAMNRWPFLQKLQQNWPSFFPAQFRAGRVMSSAWELQTGGSKMIVAAAAKSSPLWTNIGTGLDSCSLDIVDTGRNPVTGALINAEPYILKFP